MLNTIQMKVKHKRTYYSVNLLANFPVYGWLGLGLVIIFWTLNWNLEGLRTHWAFFPLWLGYSLTIDGLTFIRKGNTLLTRNPLAYFLLFLVSIPSWWLFEALNERAQYWTYTHRGAFSDIAYFFWASLSFSTVVPAVFGTAEWIGTFGWLQHLGKGPRIGKRQATIVGMFISGLILLAVVFIWPAYSAAFIWMSLYFILDPVNYWLGNRTLIQNTAYRDWREVIALWVACLICGFFWEMWNFYSSPKWLYNVPYVDFWHLFEMPLPGYLGYLPFSLELFALFHLFVSGRSRLQYYFQILPE